MTKPARDAEAGVDGAVRLLLAHDLAAFVWLDHELVVTETRGALATGIPIGRPIGLGMLALHGYDPQIKALRTTHGERLELPNIAIATAAGTGPRLNLHVVWDELSGRYLLIMTHATGQAELERELIRKARETQILKSREIEQAAEIQRINTELTRVNRDLSEFADIISHDLRAPLRGMRYYAEDLEQSIEQGNTAASKALADRLRTQSHRMTRMLSDLLAYARAGRKDEMVERVDTRALVEAIVASLPRPETHPIHVWGTWPAIETLATPLDLVLRNLIDNALKHHDRETGCIEISAAVHGEALEITVADDGPGIARHLHEVAFLPFRTLGGSGGSGMGLALVRRVLEVVGAAITLESDPAVARGTTFRVRWPIRLQIS